MCNQNRAETDLGAVVDFDAFRIFVFQIDVVSDEDMAVNTDAA